RPVAPRRRDGLPAGGVCPPPQVVGQPRAGPDEHAAAHRHPGVDGDVVLDLAAVAAPATRVHEHVLAEVAACTDHGTGTDLGVVPDPGTVADQRTVLDGGRLVDRCRDRGHGGRCYPGRWGPPL